MRIDLNQPRARLTLRAAEYVRMSTDHQKYSIANQSALIHAYAASNYMRIVRTYSDPGRSGLTIKDRPGLSLLLAEIIGGQAQFDVVLVYDVSRWGRFQDADESAHYEFLCKRAGVRVIYCAEQFASDGTPFASVLKALKRAMAGEYSRELSVKVAAGKARIGKMGFRVGGIAGYALRRQVLENGVTPGVVLRHLQRKSIQTDRVTLVPGPESEIQVVRRIYRDYIYMRKSERQISADLNSEGVTCFGRCWSRNLVRAVLGNEKYVGNNVVCQVAERLGSPKVVNPPEKWIRCDGAFQPVVPRAMFDAAGAIRRFNEKTYVTHDEILQGLALVLRREGRLTAAIINRAPELPSANTVEMRFGSLSQAYERLGYVPASRYQFHSRDRALLSVRNTAQRELAGELEICGQSCLLDDQGLITAGRLTAEVIACRYQEPRSYQKGWRIAYQRNLGASVLVACRMEADGEGVRDLLVVPRLMLEELPRFIQERHDDLLAPYRHRNMRSVAAWLRVQANSC